MATLIEGDFEGHDLRGDDFPGRLFAFWTAQEVAALLDEVGFSDVVVERLERPNDQWDLLATGRK